MATPPVVSQSTDYKLDWTTTEVRLAKGRFVHTVSRPTHDLIFRREADISTDIEIDRNSSIRLPEPTSNEEIDARYCREIRVSVTGYPEGLEIPERHEAAVFQELYRRVIEVDERCDPFDDEIIVNEEIGGGDEPEFVIRHVMRAATEAEIKACRRRTSQVGEIKPGKRGRQTIVQRSNLKASMEFYSLWLVSIDGASVAGEAFAADHRENFLNMVDPLIQREVVKAYLDFVMGGLTD